MTDLFPDIANGSLVTRINESALPFVRTDAGIANAVIIQQLNDIQILMIIQIILIFICIMIIYKMRLNK